MICMISQKHSIKLFSAVRNNYLFQSRPLKWILAAYFRQLYCVSLNFGILNLFPFLDLQMKGLYDTGAEKNVIYLVLHPYAAHRRCRGAILLYVSSIPVSQVLDSRTEDRNLYVHYRTAGIDFSTFFSFHLPLHKTW